MEVYIVYYLLGIIMLPGVILAMIAQAKVTSAYHTYQKMQSSIGKTASQVAREVLDKHNLNQITLEQVSGTLTDHYDPKADKIRLSTKVYSGTDVASIGIALHEVGHAIQHDEEYGPAKFRQAIAPVISFSSNILWPLVIIGFIFNFFGGLEVIGQVFIWIGIAFFSLSLIFSLVTLPTELDASKRAKQELETTYGVSGDELVGAKKVLNAAALTYVASLVMSILSLLRFVLAIMLTRDRN